MAKKKLSSCTRALGFCKIREDGKMEKLFVYQFNAGLFAKLK